MRHDSLGVSGLATDKTLRLIDAQVSLASIRIRAVASVAVLGEYRPNVSIEGNRLIGKCRAAQQAQHKHQASFKFLHSGGSGVTMVANVQFNQ